MRAEGRYYPECDPNFRTAVNEHAVSGNVGYRYLRRNRELRSSRVWATGLLVLLPLTAVIWVQLGSVAKAAIVGGPPRSAESLHAIQLSSCELSGVPQPARCGVLDVPENPNQPAGRHLKISVAVIPAIGGQPRPDPIAVLMGGPGEDAIGSAEIYARKFAPLKRKQVTKTRLRPLGREELAIGCGGA